MTLYLFSVHANNLNKSIKEYFTLYEINMFFYYSGSIMSGEMYGRESRMHQTNGWLFEILIFARNQNLNNLTHAYCHKCDCVLAICLKI